MDELLSFMEEGFDEDDAFQDSGSPVSSSSGLHSQSSSKSRENSSCGSVSPSGSKKAKKDLTFKDVFGSPDKRDVKELGLNVNQPGSSASSTALKRASNSVLSPKQMQLSSAIRLDKKVPYKPDASLVVIDPFSRVRLLKNTVSIYFDETVSAEAVLKDRNTGLEFVSLPSLSAWCRGKGKDAKNFWVSGVVTRKTPGVRKSANGNDYGIWELGDLKDFDRKITVFLFGAASRSSNILQLPVGALVDITTPSVMPDSSGGSAIKLSINNDSQVRFIGTSKDFGFCQAKKKNGEKCTAVVNTWECSFCIHHASGELKKLNIGKGKGRPNGNSSKNGFFPNKSFGGESQESLKQQGIVIANFGAPPNSRQSSAMNSSLGRSSSSSTTSRPSTRMELQGGNNEMKRNTIKSGNPESITFLKNGGNCKTPLLEDVKQLVVPRKPLDLNPTKTRHLSDKDRLLLQMLDSDASSSSTTTPAKTQKPGDTGKNSQSQGKSKPGVVSELIATSIVSNPNAASRNFMQFLTLQHAPKEQVDLSSKNKSSAIQPIIMSREKIKSMEKALNFVKSHGPIQKADPNAVSCKKRKLHQLSLGESSSSSQVSSKKGKGSKNIKIDVEFDFGSEEFKKILNAKSAHDDELDQIQHEEMFDKLEKKEALENKLLNTYSIETNAVMCRQCKYVALSQSEFCKEQMHEVRLVKARKRFFKCKDCGNRTMSLDRLPKRPCPNCNNSSWLVAPVGKEKKGPTLPSEMLSIRGHEEKFIGSAGSKMFLNLEV